MKSLDIGCWKQPSCKINIDRHKGIISELSKKYRDKLFVICDAEKLPFKSNSIDFIRANDIIEHLRNPEEMIMEIKRCLKSGGRLFIRTPLYPNKLFYDILLERKVREWESEHVSKFTRRKFKILIKKYFPNADVKPFIFRKIMRANWLVRAIYNRFPRKICATINVSNCETPELYPYSENF